MPTKQAEDPKKTKLYVLMVAIWASLSLFLTAELQDDIFYDFSSPQTALLWAVLSVAPLLPLLWIWLFETSPWQGIPLIGSLSMGAVTALIAFNDRQTDDWAFLPLIWSGGALLAAYLLKDKRSLREVFGQSIKTPAPNRQVQIDHVHYLHQLDEQISIGLPTVMRVRAYFIEQLPLTMPSLKVPEDGQSPFIFPADSPFSHSQMLSFMTEKTATELAYLCTVAFLDRVCGPDFRYTKQYRSMRDVFLAIPTSETSRPARTGDDGLKIETIVSGSDLDTAIKSLDAQTAKKPEEHSASNVTVSVAGLRHIIFADLVPKEQLNEDAVGKMVFAAMVKTREMFRNRTTTI